MELEKVINLEAIRGKDTAQLGLIQYTVSWLR